MNRDGNRALIEGLRQHPTLSDLKRSAFFAAHGNEIEFTLGTPDVELQSAAIPKLSSFVRVTQWNIEKGREFSRVLEALKSDPVLRWSDVLLLNEVDRGMNRSENLDVARALAQSLGMHVVFGPAHFELTKGTGEDLVLPGENAGGMQGNAILSRHPVLDACVIRLPVCFESYHSPEKRYGSRNCTWAALQIQGRRWWFGSVHLEVRDTPWCRAKQMRHLLERLPGSPADHFLLGGDLNTSGFKRGTRLRTIASVWRLTGRSFRKVREELLHPGRGVEPLFRAAREAGFGWEEFNGPGDTAIVSLDGMEDAAFLPTLIRRVVERRLAPYDQKLCLKLDWLMGRNVKALRGGQVMDTEAQVPSVDPGGVVMNREGPGRVSDHLPVYADLGYRSKP